MHRIPNEQTWRRCIYDNDADLAPHPGEEGRHHRLRLAGARARAESARTAASTCASACPPAASRAPRRRPPASTVTTRRRGRGVGRRDHVLVPDTTAGRSSTQKTIAPNLTRRQDADVRARLQHPLRHDHAAERRRRHDDRAEAPGHRVRELFVEGGGTPALLAVHQDATGNARAARALLRQGASASPAPASSRRPSRRRPRPICSASRPCSAAASARW